MQASASRGKGRAGRGPALDLDALATRWQERCAQLRRATDRVREPLALLGYACVEPETLWAARSRAGLLGTGELLASWSRRAHEDPLSVWSGGGHGVALVARSAAAARESELRAQLHEISGGGARLVTACVPYERTQESEALGWLRTALADARDELAAPAWSAEQQPTERCAGCTRPLAPLAEPQLCAGCQAAQRVGPDGGAPLAELAEEGRWVALCGGQNLIELLAGLEDLESLSALALLIGAIVDCARQEVGRASGSAPVVPACGGVQLFALLAPSDALRCAAELARQIQSLSSEAARVAGGISQAAGAHLGQLGVSLGLALVESRAPLERAFARARAAERSALRGGAALGWRSSLCAERWVVGDSDEGGIRELGRDLRPHSLEATAWRSALQRAAALRRIPFSQRGLGPIRELPDPESQNAFRALLARSPAWRRYLRVSGVDWREAAALSSGRPDRGLEVLMELVP